MNDPPISISCVGLGDEEIEAALKVLRSGRLVQGPQVQAFEEAFAAHVGTKHAIAVSSGTAALHIGYLCILEPDDEVLVPSFTHISTASMVAFAGGRPVFCDIDAETLTIDLDELERKATSKTKAVAAVHLFGNACPIDQILTFARKRGIKVLWDAAQAHGTSYHGKDVGGFNDLVCYSFYPTKNMTTGEGGMIATNEDKLAERCRLLRSHGQAKKYWHTLLGLNYRMAEVEAAIGLEQLRRLPALVETRRSNAAFLTERLSSLPGITLPMIPDGVAHSFHQFCILVDEGKARLSRDELAQRLKGKGIECRVHYPRPLHQQPVFSNNGITELPVSERVARHILSLPVHPMLTQPQLERIAQGVAEAIGSNNR